MNSMLDSVETIMRNLGSLLLEWRAQGETQGQWEGSQLKAVADRRAHDYLINQLNNQWPNIPVISEEDVKAQKAHRPDEYWLIDPIDGTASFCNGFDGFVTQIALMRKCRPVLAVVHAPALNLTYTASSEGPARCNNNPISVTTSPGKKRLIIIDNYPEPRGITKILYDAIGCDGYVESGSLGLKICRIADNTADIFFKDVPVRDWDIGAPQLILERAGGSLTDAHGHKIPYEGEYEHTGLIVTASERVAVEVARWYSKQSESSML